MHNGDVVSPQDLGQGARRQAPALEVLQRNGFKLYKEGFAHLSDAGPGPELELCGAVLVEVLGDHIRGRLRDPAPGDFFASPQPF